MDREDVINNKSFILSVLDDIEKKDRLDHHLDKIREENLKGYKQLSGLSSDQNIQLYYKIVEDGYNWIDFTVIGSSYNSGYYDIKQTFRLYFSEIKNICMEFLKEFLGVSNSFKMENDKKYFKIGNSDVIYTY